MGVIAEEKNDVEVIYQLTCKLVQKRSFKFHQFIGHGCGKVRKKCRAWAKNLIARGCTHIVVLHDLDEFNENELREELEVSIRDLRYTASIILIPVYEIEAWLLFDPDAIRKAFSMTKTPKVPRRPEIIKDPKEKLKEIVWHNSRKYYVNTIHNQRIAALMDISKLSNCNSFRLYPQFISIHFNQGSKPA